MGKNKLVSILAMASIGTVVAVGAGHYYNSNSNTKVVNNRVLLSNNSGNKAAVINGNGSLVLRSGTSSNSKLMGYLSVGEMLTINSKDGDCYNVTVQETGATGYINSSNLKVIHSGINDSLNNLKSNGSIINVTRNVNLRENPTMDSSIIDKLSNGNSVEIIGKQGSWYKVNINGSTGFIYDLYVANSNNDNQISDSGNSGNSSNNTVNNNQGNDTANGENNSSNNTNNGQVNNPSNDSQLSEVIKGHVVNTDGGTAPLYEKATTASRLLGGIGVNDTVTILGQDSNFYKVKYKDMIAYVPSRYINIDNNSVYEISGEATISNSNASVGVHEDASDKTTTVGILIPGSIVKVLNRTGNYYKIEFGNNEVGYAPVQYITFVTSDQIPVIANSNGEDVNVYTSGDDQSEILGTLKPNSTIKIVEREGIYYKIDYNKGVGYVPVKYVVYKTAY